MTDPLQPVALTDGDIEQVIAKSRTIQRSLGNPGRMSQIEIMLRAMQPTSTERAGVIYVTHDMRERMTDADWQDMFDRGLCEYDERTGRLEVTAHGQSMVLRDVAVWNGMMPGDFTARKLPDPVYTPEARGRLIDID